MYKHIDTGIYDTDIYDTDMIYQIFQNVVQPVASKNTIQTIEVEVEVHDRGSSHRNLLSKAKSLKNVCVHSAKNCTMERNKSMPEG